MTRRIFTLALSLFLLSVSALAATEQTSPFTRIRIYEGQFPDLPADSVFYENVVALYEYGLSGGKTDGTYGLKDYLTVGQAVIFASRIRSLYDYGSAELGAEAFRLPNTQQPTAEPYLQHLKSLDLIGNELDDRIFQTATRAEMAHVLANLLPAEFLPPINDDIVTQAYAQRQFILDVTEYTPYQADILSLYRSGVCAGADAQGSFLPEQPITRGAVAAMLTRLVDSALRLELVWKPAGFVSAEGTTLADLVVPGEYIEAPSTPEEFDSCIRYMLSSGASQLSLRYASLTKEDAQQIMTQCMGIVKSYCEQSYNSVSCSYTQSGNITLWFSAVAAGNQLKEYRTATMDAAIEVHDRLWQNGDITANMTQFEKAWIYYLWICNSCVYDYQAGNQSLSHIPYGLFYHGTAVCDGYTGAYNLLLKLEGIDCYAYVDDTHIWTVATLDGTEYHIDTTWGDSSSGILQHYFGMTPERSFQLHAAA